MDRGNVNESIMESVDPSQSVVSPPSAASSEVLPPEPARQPAPRQVSQSVVRSVQSDRPPSTKAVKRLRFGICCSGVCMLFFIFLAVGMPPLLEGILRSQAGQQAVMSKDNEKIWSKIPGQSETEFVRAFSFFNFSNWEDFYFYGKKPQFREIQGYQITEEQEDFDIEYFDGDDKVRYKYFLHFGEKEGTRGLNETVHVMNAGPLGFWYQLKHANQSQLFNQALGLLFTNLQTIVKDVVLAQGIAAQYLTDFPTTWAGMFEPADISQKKARRIWEDITFGLNNQDNLGPWIIAARNGLTSEDAQKLGVYFGLTTYQLGSVMDFFGKVIRALNDLVFENFYCGDGSECSGFRLAARQMATSGVTNNTPPVKGITPSETLCLKNLTCLGGLPEISVYYDKVFRPDHPDKQYENISFSTDLSERWFKHSKPVTTNEDTLLHAGNLQALFGNGTLFDQTAKQQYLTNIRLRFGNMTRQQGIVFWSWVKHFLNEFVLKHKAGGTEQQVAIGLVGSDWFYKSYTKAEDQLYTLLLQYKLHNLTSVTNCQKLFNDSMPNLSPKSLDALCGKYDIPSTDSVLQLVYVCLNKFGREWQLFRDTGSLTDYQMESLCDKNADQGFGMYLQTADSYLRDWYGCQQSPSGYCSNYWLGCMQWANSTVTINPIPQLPNQYPKSTTSKDWFKDVRPFEYGHFISKYPDKKLQRFSTSASAHLINWAGIFSLFTIQKIMLANTTATIPPELEIEDLRNFQDYLRYIVVFVTFDGLVKERSVYQLIFGFNDGLLTYMKQDIDPCRGGDPSIPNWIHFNDENITKDRSTVIEVYTGKSNHTKTGFFSKINGVNWINMNVSKWNGNETFSYLKNPWGEYDMLEGTDGKQSAPNQFQVDQINVFIPNLLRHGTGKWSGDSYERYGLTIYKGAISDELYNCAEEDPRQAKYYATYHGTLNLTSLNGFPVFMTKNHFKDTSSNWSELVEIWDQNKTFIYQPSSWDDSYIHYEPYSGATFSAVLFLQSSYLHSQDHLFTRNETMLMPIFSINRGGNFSQAGVNKVFGLLKTGLTLKVVCLWVGIAVSVLLAALLAFFIIRYRKATTAKPTDENELLISMQETHQDPEPEDKPADKRVNASTVVDV